MFDDVNDGKKPKKADSNDPIAYFDKVNDGKTDEVYVDDLDLKMNLDFATEAATSSLKKTHQDQMKEVKEKEKLDKQKRAQDREKAFKKKIREKISHRCKAEL